MPWFHFDRTRQLYLSPQQFMRRRGLVRQGRGSGALNAPAAPPRTPLGVSGDLSGYGIRHVDKGDQV
jgi:hypothetical protein